MCGISGIFYTEKKNFYKNQNLIKRYTFKLKHRGPDDQRIWFPKKKKI